MTLTRLGITATIGMYLLLLTGSLVTNTGSAAGCGSAWPFCDGDWTSLATFIEVNHRLVTAILGLMILVLSVGAWRAHGRRGEIRLFVAASLFLLALQSFLGAAAVMWGSSAGVMATHFGVSLASFGAVFVLTLRLLDLERGSRREEPAPADARMERFRRLVYTLMILSLVVIYIGAYVRHTASGLACAGWPLCNGLWFPGLSGPVGIVFIHRVSAGLLILLAAHMALRARELRQHRPELHKGALLALVILVAQALTGWLVVTTRATVAANMLHAAVLILYAAVLFYLAVRSFPWSDRYAPATSGHPVPAQGGR